jgi:hypothetical protein
MSALRLAESVAHAAKLARCSSRRNEERTDRFNGIHARAVRIENNTDWNFKDLEEMQRSTKTLKRNNKESREILIGPSMAPRFFRVSKIASRCFFIYCTRYVGFGLKFLGTDGKPT